MKIFNLTTKNRALLRSLNTKQKYFYNHVIKWIKINDAPLYYFSLWDGAGVDKSVVIRKLYQKLYMYPNLKEGVTQVKSKWCYVLTQEINDSTISSAFKQVYKQTLTCATLN